MAGDLRLLRPDRDGDDRLPPGGGCHLNAFRYSPRRIAIKPAARMPPTRIHPHAHGDPSVSGRGPDVGSTSGRLRTSRHVHCADSAWQHPIQISDTPTVSSEASSASKLNRVSAEDQGGIELGREPSVRGTKGT